MDFKATGAQRVCAALTQSEIDRVARLFGPENRPGARLDRSALERVGDLICPTGAVGRIAAQILGIRAAPRRALLLDKSPKVNWRLGWHQDRTIAVRERIEVPGFGGWSINAGQLHVQPPHEITARMITLRVHVDSVGRENAPLRILPGSHLLGVLSNSEVSALAAASEELVCLADAGDVWVYSTATVHASSEQREPGRRRVLQVDYSADDLPGRLEWTELLENA